MSEDYNILSTVKWKVPKTIFVISISWSYPFSFPVVKELQEFLLRTALLTYFILFCIALCLALGNLRPLVIWCYQAASAVTTEPQQPTNYQTPKSIFCLHQQRTHSRLKYDAFLSKHSICRELSSLYLQPFRLKSLKQKEKAANSTLQKTGIALISDTTYKSFRKTSISHYLISYCTLLLFISSSSLASTSVFHVDSHQIKTYTTDNIKKKKKKQ